MEMKFFAKDVVKGKFGKVGDKFVAVAIGGECKFVVVSIHDGFFMAEML